MKKTVLLSALALFLSAALFGQTLGRVEYLEGKAELTRNGEVLRGFDIGTEIENLDIVKTDGDSSVTIAFTRGSGLTGTLQIVPSTTAVIRQDQINAKPSNDIKLLTGSIKMKVERIAGMNSSVQVRTPSSVLGVRGTEFVVATFNGATLVGCSSHSVWCSPYDEVSGTGSVSSSKGSLAEPGTMVSVLENGSFAPIAYDKARFDENWKSVSAKWRTFNEELVSANPVAFIDQFVGNWDRYSADVLAADRKLRSNRTLLSWLDAAAKGKSIGTFQNWVKERPSVVQDLIAMRQPMIPTIITVYRLQELIPLVSEADMGKKLSNGKTVREFIAAYRRDSQKVTLAIALFAAAEKQYMLRNDGISPFSDF